jgi:hypothetical protein
MTITPEQKDPLRPIVGVENRTAQEVFDIMCDRIRAALEAAERRAGEAEAALEELTQIAGDLSGYFIQRPQQIPDAEFVNVCNGDLRKISEWLESRNRSPLHERVASACLAEAERDTLRARVERLEAEIEYLTREHGNGGEPVILDLCYTAFMAAHEPNKEDGGASDWFTDTRPRMLALVQTIRNAALTKKEPTDER